MSFFSKQEFQKFKGTLDHALHKTAKLAVKGQMVNQLQFKLIMEEHWLDSSLCAIDKITYTFKGNRTPSFKVTCSVSGKSFVGTFYLRLPDGKFQSNSPIVCDVNVLEK